MELTITENIKEVYKDIRDDVTVIAVSKTKPLEDIKEAYDSGVRNFGENKVQELIYKMDNFPHADVNWHLLGHLQRNKVKYIVGRVNLIHSLDSVKLLEEIQRQYEKQEKIAEVLIQINIGREESKTGIFIEDLENVLENCRKCNNVMVKGLMAIIPIGDEESCRKYFKDMREIFDKLKEKKYENVEMKYLSMGMSADYKIAIEEGANMVRIGEGIFGKRDYNV